MDFEKIKEIMPKKGERYILIENGKPEIVLLSFDDYREITESNVMPVADFTSEPAIRPLDIIQATEPIKPIEPEEVSAPVAPSKEPADQVASKIEEEVEQMIISPIESPEEPAPDATKQELPEASGDEASELTIDDLLF